MWILVIQLLFFTNSIFSAPTTVPSPTFDVNYIAFQSQSEKSVYLVAFISKELDKSSLKDVSVEVMLQDKDSRVSVGFAENIAPSILGFSFDIGKDKLKNNSCYFFNIKKGQEHIVYNVKWLYTGERMTADLIFERPDVWLWILRFIFMYCTLLLSFIFLKHFREVLLVEFMKRLKEIEEALREQANQDENALGE